MFIYTLLSRITCFLYEITGFVFLFNLCTWCLDQNIRIEHDLYIRSMRLKLFRRGFALSEIVTYDKIDLEQLILLTNDPFFDFNLRHEDLDQFGYTERVKQYAIEQINKPVKSLDFDDDIINGLTNDARQEYFERNQLDIETQELEFITEAPCKKCGDYFEDSKLNYLGMCFNCECEHEQPYKGKL